MTCSRTDEVGLIVKHIDEDGSVYFDPVGMVNAAMLPACPVHICTRNGILP